MPSARAIIVLLALALTGCGGSSSPTASSGTTRVATSSGQSAHGAAARPRHRAGPPPYPQLLGSPLRHAPGPFVPAVRVHGRTAAWIARSASGITLLSVTQQLVQLHLHSGTIDAGAGYRFGPWVAGAERRGLLAAFNGGFKLSVGAGGFSAGGHTAVALRDGLGSIVTYTDGTTDIGSWHGEVPARGKAVASVRQNLTLLIDHGQAASTVDCQSCWGATLGGVADPARSALGITADGHLIWAGAEHATAADLAAVMRDARVVRAVELDINPEWVAGYLYGHGHGSGPLTPVAVVAGQQGIPGMFLEPWSRDFFTLVAR